MQNSKPVLLVEESREDEITVERALKDLKVANQVVQANNGEESLDYLRNESNEKPCVILLDLNMPKMNGIEFLKAIKANEELKNIPVIVLTTSDEQQDIMESFNLHAAGYMLKSVDYKQFADTVRAIDFYWSLSKLPNRG